MKEAFLIRKSRSLHGTHGHLYIPSVGFSCYTGELPWKNNKVKKSCIPTGRYVCRIRQSPKYGKVFWLTDVKGRTYVLIHAGNYSGDVDKGLKTHTLGCILLGKKIGYLSGQRSVLNSRITVQKFQSLMGSEDFYLNVA